MTTDPGEPSSDRTAAESAPPEPEAPPEPGTPPAESEAPPMRDGAGWIGFGVSGAAFVASLSIGWPDAILFAALGLAFALTGLVRSSRGRATNGRYALAGVALALATVVLGFVWASRAEPCRAYHDDRAQWDACYSERTGLF